MNRFWDTENKYSGGVLKEYQYWVLEVSYRQHTFGNYIIFCKRSGVEALAELQDEELVELKRVLQEIEAALRTNSTFRPIRFNYWQMGNAVHHLHIHGLPRYDSARQFLGREWQDGDSTKPSAWTYEQQSEETVEAFKNEIMKTLK